MPLDATGSGKTKEYVYAVLARDYYDGPDWCCTCLHLDSQLHIYGYKDINIAISRLNNKDYCCPIKEKAPKEQLQYLLSQRMLLTPALHDVVAEMEETYNARLENNCNITGVITPTAISCDATPSATEDDKASTDNISCEATPSANKDDEETPTGMKMTNAVKDGTFIETKKALTKKRKRRTTARVHSTAADDISCAATPSANEHEKANPTRIKRTKAVKERTVRENEQERRQKCLTKNSTSPNKKGPVNTRVRNWMLAMRRNMKPEVKEAAL